MGVWFAEAFLRRAVQLLSGCYCFSLRIEADVAQLQLRMMTSCWPGFTQEPGWEGGRRSG